MDNENYRAITSQAEKDKVVRIADFLTTHREYTTVPDPYYGDYSDFELVIDAGGCLPRTAEKFNRMNNNIYLASKPRYEILDGLRGVAAMIVVAFHLFVITFRQRKSSYSVILKRCFPCFCTFVASRANIRLANGAKIYLFIDEYDPSPTRFSWTNIATRYGKPKMYNSKMVLYFIDNYVHNDCEIPDRMIDDNIRTDYNKLRMLIRHNKELMVVCEEVTE